MATALAAVVTAAVVVGCAPQARPSTAVPPSSSPTRARPAPTVTVVRSARVVAAGAAAVVTAQAGVRLRLQASRPAVSRTRLSASYGYAPARGYYVTFALTITNTGRAAVDIGPANFRVSIPGEGTVRPYDGNAAYSGASQQLDTTQLDPGGVLRAPLTFDVRRPHGTLAYVPDASAALTWRF